MTNTGTIMVAKFIGENNMDKQEFIKQQYITLREEIKETKARIFKTLSFGLVVVPAANFLANSYQVDVLIMLMPLLIIVVALIYLSENRAKMRCGRYIRLHIEGKIKDIEPGWETWLEDPCRYDVVPYDTRCVDKYLDYCFYILFFIYFSSSVFLAAKFAHIKYGLIVTSLLLGSYTAVGMCFMYFLIKHIQFCTTLRGDANKNKKTLETNTEQPISND